MGGLQAKSMTSQRNRAVKDGGYVSLWQRYDNNKMADMCYHGNVRQQQGGGYALPWKQ